jgi:hypothetical protein
MLWERAACWQWVMALWMPGGVPGGVFDFHPVPVLILTSVSGEILISMSGA